MSKKFILLALSAIGAVAMLALPAAASAVIPLHAVPTPKAATPIDFVAGVTPKLTTVNSTIECEEFSGSATWESGTTGKINLTFGKDCKSSGATCNSTGAAAGTIKTTELPFHLVTLAGKSPGVLITPSSDGSFAHIECGFGLIKFTVGGNGVLGTITSPTCGSSATSATIAFSQTANGVQQHTKLEGTETIYTLTKGTENAAQSGTGKITFAESTKLECT